MSPLTVSFLQAVASQAALPANEPGINPPQVQALNIYATWGVVLLSVIIAAMVATVCYFRGKKNLSDLDQKRKKLEDDAAKLTPEEYQQERQRLDDHPLQVYGLHLLASHPLVVGTVLTATCVVVEAALLRLFLVICFDCPWDQWRESPNNWIVREFSAAGLREYVFAMLGVLAGIIATLVVEKTSSARTANIESTSTNIHEQVNQLKQVLGVRAIKDLRELIDEILSVFKTAQERPSNWLWIMNPTAAYGYFNTFDADNVLDRAGLPVGAKYADRPNHLSQLKRSQYDDFQTQLVDEHKRLKRELEKAIGKIRDTYSQEGGACDAALNDVEFGGVKFNRIECATLSSNLEQGDEETETQQEADHRSHYLREFVLPAITGKESVSKADHARVAVLDVEQYWAERAKFEAATKKEKLFLVPIRKLHSAAQTEVELDKQNETAVLNWLLGHLNDKQRRYIDDFNALTKCVREMKHVPMQMFMSLDPSEKNSICLVVFSNRYTLSRSNDLAAFRITEPSTIKTFKSMFMAIVAQERIGV